PPARRRSRHPRRHPVRPDARPRRPRGLTASRERGGGGERMPGRHLVVRVKSARRRKPSSAEWLARQLNDPYVAEARRLGYRSRAAFKLIQLDERFRLLAPGRRIVDLGCAPGGWTQIAAQRVGPRGKVVGID